MSNNCSHILKGLLAWLIREKKTSKYFGSSIISFESISNITKKLPSLPTLINSTVLHESFGVENHIYWLWKWSIRTGESSILEIMIIGLELLMSFLNQRYTSLWLKLLFLLSDISKVFIYPTKCQLCYLEPNRITSGFKPS